MTVIVRGYTGASRGGLGWDGTYTIGLPVDTEVGDWAYVVGCSSLDFTVTHAGFERAAILDVAGFGYGEAWVGQLADLSPISYYTNTNQGGALAGQSVIVVTSPNRPNLSRVAQVTSTTDAFVLPGVPGRGHGAIALGVATHGIGSAVWDGTPTFASRATTGAYYVSAWGVSHEAVISAEPSAWSYASGETSNGMVVIGVGGLADAPPCRLFPRSDGLGVGGGRIYPPPVSQQRSGRRFGYY